MIKSFSSSLSPTEFVTKATEALAGRELGKIVSMELQEAEMIILFKKLGTSKVFFSLTKDNSGFTCEHKDEKIALTHKALRSDIEAKLAKVLESIGTQVSNA